MAEPKKAAGGTLFHVLTGQTPFMYRVDMDVALNQHGDEYKDRPWTEDEIEAYKNRDQTAAPAAEPEPPEPPEPEPEETDETQSRRRRSRK